MRYVFLITLLLSFMNVHNMDAQNNDIVYLRFKSKSGESNEGVYRSNSNTNDAVYKYAPIHFRLRFKSKNISGDLGHYNFNTTELSKIRKVTSDDQMEVLTKPWSFLNTIQVIDLDQLLIEKNKENFDNFIDSLRGKKIYVIDENDFKTTFPSNKTIKLIQVIVLPRRKPSQLIIEE